MPRFVDRVKLFTDGGCRGNPGPGAIGVLILDADNNEMYTHSACFGQTTNNRAEYRALIKGLDACARFTRRRVTCYTDSQLVVNQMTGVWRLKDDELRSLFHQAKDLERPFDEVIYQYIERTNQYIKKVDKFLNEAFEGR